MATDPTYRRLNDLTAQLEQRQWWSTGRHLTAGFLLAVGLLTVVPTVAGSLRSLTP
jgi:hypothetical protein